MRITKRVLAVLLAVVMTVSMLPGAVAADFVRTESWSSADFTDVKRGDWFYQNVKEVYELGLMVGRSNGAFDPAGQVTLAEAVTLAARLHTIAATGKDHFVQGTPWYKVYVDYAVQNGILDAALSEPNRAATREEFARILARALPAEQLQEINDVYDGQIPDVEDDPAVYMLYRAGVLTGSDGWGSFFPDNTIARREAAAIVTRMALPEMRQTVYFGGDEPEMEEPEEPEDDRVITASVKVTASGAVEDAVTMEQEGLEFKATVPAGTQMEDGAGELALSVKPLEESASVTAGDDQTLTAMDVHMEGVSASNDKAILVELGEILSKGMNLGNVTLYHTENGTANEMTQVMSLSDLDAHNEFYYDPATGCVTVALATFSEIAVVADTEKAWEGGFDYSWYINAVASVDGEAVTEYTIANADQLAAFGAIVGGMDGKTQDSFKGKTVKLISDINLGDKESENNPNIIFYPIGYYNSEGTYERTNTAITSGLRIFEGSTLRQP